MNAPIEFEELLRWFKLRYENKVWLRVFLSNDRFYNEGCGCMGAEKGWSACHCRMMYALYENKDKLLKEVGHEQ